MMASQQEMTQATLLNALSCFLLFEPVSAPFQ